jgi:XTP/dITP diphosphohydrolase
MSAKRTIHYVTSSAYKQEENKILREHCVLNTGEKVDDIFEFVFRTEQIKEMLEVDLFIMVQAEVADAYSRIKVPCIVEHAGLIFDEYIDESYPGGLTKPMWNTLGEKFLQETGSANRRATARAVVAYCDGKSIQTFKGETTGKLAASPRGKREFYWDTVFIPDDASGIAADKTYAEIVADPNLGLDYKVTKLSQSTKAMIEFLNYVNLSPRPSLWGP